MDAQQHSEIATAVSGSPEGGFIVDMHDGEHHHAHISHADDAEAAEAEGKREFASLHHRDRHDEDDHSHSHSEVAGMRQEIDDLRASVTKLEANVGDLLKHREGVKSAADQDHAREVRDLQSRVDRANDAIEHHMDDGDSDHVQRDAHGQDVRDPNRVHTAATESSHDEPLHEADPAVETDAERNAREAGTHGVVNRENPAAASKDATYADRGDGVEHD